MQGVWSAVDPVGERIRLENSARRLGYDVQFIWAAVNDSMANKSEQDTAAFNREFERTLYTIANGFWQRDKRR